MDDGVDDINRINAFEWTELNLTLINVIITIIIKISTPPSESEIIATNTTNVTNEGKGTAILIINN